MSEHIPFELQAEIIRRTVSVKSLLRFRSVCKQWKSLIDSDEFIALHSVNQAHLHHLLVRYDSVSGHEFVSMVDDDDNDDDGDVFPKNKLSPILSPSLKLISFALMLDCSHGLVCLYGWDVYGKSHVVLWNPSLGKSVGIGLPNRPMAVGFGVCPKTIEPKILSITSSNEINWEVEIFTLSSGAWRSIPMNVQLSGSTQFDSQQVVVDGVIYWAAHDQPNERWGLIVAFELISEEFREVAVPDDLANKFFDLFKLNESVAVLDVNEFEMSCDVWVMKENGFVKLFSLGFTPYDGHQRFDIIGFRKNGQPIREHPCERDGFLVTKLEAYEPSTRHSRDVGIYIPYGHDPFEPHIMMTSYTESLLLLHHSDSSNKGISSSKPAADSNAF